MSHNERRAGKALIAMRGSGGQVRVRAFQNEFAEANWVAAQIADALAAGNPTRGGPRARSYRIRD